MALVATDLGSAAAVALVTGQALTLHLFQNNYTPVKGSVLANFTEANFGGYTGGVALAGWTAPALSAGRMVSQANPITQTCDGTGAANTIYGYYVKDAANVVQWAERNPVGGTVISVVGQQFVVLPKYSQVSEF